MSFILRVAVVLWASPYTAIGLLIGGLGLCSKGRVRMCDGVIEFHGGGTRWFLQRLPVPGFQHALAITFGHTVLGQTEAALDLAHDHEMIHVRQYERWGPMMGPAYLTCSLFLWLSGRDPYRDNPFERKAYDQIDFRREC